MSSKKIVCIEGTKSLKPNFGPCVDDCSYFSSLTFWSFQHPFGSNEILSDSSLCLPFKYDVYLLNISTLWLQFSN